MSDTTILDLDSLMNSSLDGIEEAPEFIDPPTGLYRFQVTSAKVVKGKEGKASTINLVYSVVETLETKETPVPDGTMTSERFQLTQQGLGFFKPKARKILNVENLDGVSLVEVLDSLNGAEFKARLSYTTSTGKAGTPNEGKTFINKRFTVMDNE